MAIHQAHDVATPGETQRACFLCALDSQNRCHEQQLEGRVIAVAQRTADGERAPTIVLDSGGARIELQLSDQYYRSLVKELEARLHTDRAFLHRTRLTLRAYHLPAPAIAPYRDTERLCYKGNSYTLAVLEPDILLNITDLSQAEYCQRQHLLARLSPSPASAATVRGNLVHYCFKELLKEHDPGRLYASQAAQETPLETLRRHLDEALRLSSLDLALANISSEAMRAEVEPHLESLAHWYESKRSTLWDMAAAPDDAGASHPMRADDQAADGQTGASPVSTPATVGNQVRAETFLLAPEIGLRGRLDLFWQHAGQRSLLELKTGGGRADQLPRTEHRWQVYGYHALLAVRRDSQMKKASATLLYSGTPGQAQDYAIPASIREIQRVNERRNLLIISHITGVPPEPPSPARCTKCAMLDQCRAISPVLGWQEPQPDAAPQPGIAVPDAITTGATVAPARLIDTEEDRVFLAGYYRLLHLEGRAGEQQQALLWNTPVAERIARGTALYGLGPLEAPAVDKDGWRQSFRCTNTSELREGDEILLSDGDPIGGEVVSGTITEISAAQVTVWTRELLAHPALIDRYENDLVHVRTLQNLLRWLQAAPHLRDLVAGKVRPRFIDEDATPRADFNSEQNLAVARAMQMQDYLLIHGPPGTGKTSVIAEIVKRLRARGQRVMLAAFTNQAVDNMLRRLDREGFHDYLRLGHERSVDEAVQHRLLKALLDARQDEPAGGYNPEAVYDLLHSMPVVASTTATWSSDRYAASSSPDQPGAQDMYFDVAIVDEAGQLTVPAILGALRFTRRFILVGDEKQLPPLVLSEEAARGGATVGPGLADALFTILKRRDEAYMREYPLAVSACVPLRVQYRMNRWIANFSSTVFYDKELIAHKSVAHRRLILKAAPSAPEPQIARAIAPERPLVFLDVREEPGEAMQGDGKTSNAEARAVRAIVAELLVRGIAPGDIGVIAPYRAQVANIRRHLFSDDEAHAWRALDADAGLCVDTVDRFQGGERMVMLISFATTTEPEVESQRRAFLVNEHRLNVALTRAQRKLILVGCVPALERLPILSRLITYCRSMHTVIPYGGN